MNENEYSADEIAAAYWQLLTEKHVELRQSNDALTAVMAEVYVSQDSRDAKERDAERKIRRASDDVIILGLVIERAKANRLVAAKG